MTPRRQRLNRLVGDALTCVVLLALVLALAALLARLVGFVGPGA